MIIYFKITRVFKEGFLARAAVSHGKEHKSDNRKGSGIGDHPSVCV